MTETTEPPMHLPQNAATAPPHPLSLGLVLKILSQGKHTILVVTLTTFVLASILAFALPTVYTATASFVPPGASSSSGAAALMGQLSSLGAGSLLGSKTQGDLYVEFLRSHTLRRLLVQRFHLQNVYHADKESAAESTLSKKSAFDVDPKSSVVSISVTDKDAGRAYGLTEGYLEALQQTAGDMALTESSQRRSFYEHRLAQERDELANAEIALKQNQEKTGLVAPIGQTSAQIQTLTNLRAQISGRKVQLAAQLYSESEQNPDVIRMRNEISSLESQVQQLESGQAKDGFGHFSTAQVPELELEYFRRSRDVQYHTTLFGIISRQYEAARLDEAKDSPLQILDHATVPDEPSGPRRKLIVAAGLLTGMILGSAWCLIRSASVATAL